MILTIRRNEARRQANSNDDEEAPSTASVQTESRLGSAATLEKQGIVPEQELTPEFHQGEIFDTSPRERLSRLGTRVTPDGASESSEIEVNVDGRLRTIEEGTNSMPWATSGPLFRRPETFEPTPPRYPREEDATSIAYYASRPGAGDPLLGRVSAERLGEGFVRRETSYDAGSGNHEIKTYHFDGNEYEVIK